MEHSGTIALTIGDPNGIGPEIAIKAAAARAGEAPPIVVGDLAVMRTYAQRHAPEFPLRIMSNGGTVERGAINVAPVDGLPAAAFRPGTIDAAAGAATVAYVEAALALVRAGTARAIVACPHSETAVNAAGIAFSGYPSLLARLLGVAADRVFLMLVAGDLRIVHATLHERLATALARLSTDLIEHAALAARDALVRLGIAEPRLALFAINPHAGEGGLFGDDDERISVPAAQRLRAAGLAVAGPTGADVLLAQRDADVYVAMYHDQGHIPIKLLAPRTASALSIGTGLLFSTVGHGSGFDIAGHGTADPAGVLRALALLTSATRADERTQRSLTR